MDRKIQNPARREVTGIAAREPLRKSRDVLEAVRVARRTEGGDG